MKESPPLLIEIRPSAQKLYLLLAAHLLALISILLISDFGPAGSMLKAALILLVAVSLKQSLTDHVHSIRLVLKDNALAELRIGSREHHELQLSGDSYVSDLLLQLVFTDGTSAASRCVSVFPDSMDAAMHSQLRARLKLVTTPAGTYSA